jgi:hypothetical protein
VEKQEPSYTVVVYDGSCFSTGTVIHNMRNVDTVMRNNDTWFEGKWMQLEDIMISEVS